MAKREVGASGGAAAAFLTTSMAKGQMALTVYKSVMAIAKVAKALGV